MSSPIIYNTMLFTDIWESAEEFKTEYKASPLYIQGQRLFDGVEKVNNVTMPDNISLLYYLLYSKYGNSAIANDDINQFKFKVWTTIFNYGPKWQKDLEIQARLRGLSESDIMTGGKIIYNHAYHDAADPSTDSLTETNYIDEQNTTNNLKSYLAAYNELTALLDTDVTELFLKKFVRLFKLMPLRDRPLNIFEEEE